MPPNGGFGHASLFCNLLYILSFFQKLLREGIGTLFLDSLEAVVGRARLDHPRNDVVLWGNSFGGKVGTAVLWDRAERLAELGVSAAVLTVPGNYQRSESMPLPFSLLRLLLAGPLARFPVKAALIPSYFTISTKPRPLMKSTKSLK